MTKCLSSVEWNRRARKKKKGKCITIITVRPGQVRVLSGFLLTSGPVNAKAFSLEHVQGDSCAVHSFTIILIKKKKPTTT